MSALDARAVVTFAFALLVLTASSQAQVLPPPGPDGAIEPAPTGPGVAPEGGDDSHDVLTRGPIHEAFAEQYNADPGEGLVIPKAPPEPIDEIPPETMPEGNNMQWVSGYWGWDDERQDFIWISGLWRDIPPGQRWVPGYWVPAESGYQWVSGFWTGSESAELDYQADAPPQTLEQGPNIEAPGEDHFWVPGVWVYDSGYRWRAGYWAPAYDEWVWVPDRWVWTPYGFVYCAGYYDYRLPVRAVAFAPVYFTHVHWWHHRPFCPSVVLDSGPLTMHWFVRPNYNHYYFGDYYADTYYTGWGLQPWYTCRFGFGGYGGWRHRHCHYDPLFTFYAGYHRRHHRVDFGDRMHRWHNHYTAHADDRPRWTKRDQDNFDDAMRKAGRVRGDGKQARIGRDFNEFVANPSERDQKFVKLDGRQRDRHTKVAKETVQLATLRHDLETDGGRVRGVRGDGKKNGGNGSDATIALPGANGGAGDNNSGNRRDGERGSRKLKLPKDQGAGDQVVVTEEGNREPNRRKGRVKTPDGPPGGNNAIVGGNGNQDGERNRGSGGNNSRRGRSDGLADGNLGPDGNNNAGQNSNNGRGNKNGQDNNRRGGRGSNDPAVTDNPPALGGGAGQNPVTGDGTDNGSSRGRNRNRGNNNNNNDNGNQGFNPLRGNDPSGGADRGNSGGDGSKGSNRDRTPRRGNSGNGNGNGNGNNGFGGGTPGFNPQPLPDSGGNNPGSGNNGKGSNSGRSRSRGGSGSFDFNPNSGGSNSGNGGSNSGNSGGGGDKQRRGGGGNSGQGFGSGNGNPSSGSGVGSGGGGSRRNQGGSNGGGGGGSKSDRKKKD